MALTKRAAAPAAASNVARAPAGARGAAGAPRFEYRARTVEDVKKLAKESGGRDNYWDPAVQFFTPAVGPNTVRILPPPIRLADSWRHFGKRIWEHRDIGVDGGAYLCKNKMLGELCAVCEEREVAANAGEKLLADDLRASCRTALYLIDRANPSKGPQLWAISAGGPKATDTTLLNLSVDGTTGELLQVDNPYEGYDLSFTRIGQGFTTTYSGWSFARRASPLSDVTEQLEKWLGFVDDHDIEKMLVWHEHDYVAGVLESQPPGGSRKQRQQGQTGQQQAAAPAPAQAERPALQRRNVTPPVQQPVQQAQPAQAQANPAPTWEELQSMPEAILEEVINEYQIDAPPDGFDTRGDDGNDHIREWIADTLQVLRPQPVRQPAAAAAPAAQAAGGGWRSRLENMKQ